MNKFNPIIEVEKDEFFLPKPVGPWAENKYSLMGGYSSIFNQGIKNKFKNRVYIDLFSGAGYAPIKGRNKILKSSPLISLSIPEPFTHYIFCELNRKKLNALKCRVERDYPDKLDSIYFVEGDSNKNIGEVVKIIKKLGQSTISFCFVDPFSLNLHFSTIGELSKVGKIDFLILLALQMDANRNYIYYSEEENKKIDLFIDRSNWRDPFKNLKVSRNDFIKYLAQVYDENMLQLGYKVKNEGLKPRVDANQYNLALYYLAFYSKNDLGNKFFKEIQKYHLSQQKLF